MGIFTQNSLDGEEFITENPGIYLALAGGFIIGIPTMLHKEEENRKIKKVAEQRNISKDNCKMNYKIVLDSEWKFVRQSLKEVQ